MARGRTTLLEDRFVAVLVWLMPRPDDPTSQVMMAQVFALESSHMWVPKNHRQPVFYVDGLDEDVAVLRVAEMLGNGDLEPWEPNSGRWNLIDLPVRDESSS